VIQALLFYFFAAVMVAAALGVILVRNPVHAVMLLILTFFQSAVLWLMAEAEFLAIVLVLVYVGAVMVLFLFVVMMLDLNVERIRGGFTRYYPYGAAVALLMVIELVQVIWLRSREGQGEATTGFQPTPEGYSNTESLGAILYTEHVYAFEIAAVILLLAIVAAITLTMRRRPGLKVQDIAKQVSVRPQDRIRIVTMKAEERR
jgi:NADH-quinone oxidoreductase subunit J